MFDKGLIKDILTQVIESVDIAEERCNFANSEDDFLDTKEGLEKLDAICMKLIGIGESLKKIDKITDRKLLALYPQIEWKKVIGIRDFISHHYFDLDADIIYGICKDHIGVLKDTLKKIKKDLE